MDVANFVIGVIVFGAVLVFLIGTIYIMDPLARDSLEAVETVRAILEATPSPYR